MAGSIFDELRKDFGIDDQDSLVEPVPLAASEPLTETPDTPSGDIFDELRAEYGTGEGSTDVLTNLSMRQGVTQNPDEYAKLLELSKKTGKPVEAVRTNKDNITQDLAFKNSQTFQRDNPGLTTFLGNKDNAAVSHDDLPALAGIEKIITDFSKPIDFDKFEKPEERGTLGDLGRASLSGLAKYQGGIGGFIEKVSRSVIPDEFLDEEGKILGWNLPGGDTREATEKAIEKIDFKVRPGATTAEIEKRLVNDGISLGLAGDLAYLMAVTGAESMWYMLASVTGVGLATNYATLNSQLAEDRAVNKGVDRAGLAELIETAPGAAFSTLLDKIGTKGVTDMFIDDKKMLSKSGTELFKFLAKKMGKGLTKESATEGVQETGEYLSTTAFTNEDVTLEEAARTFVWGSVLSFGISGPASAAATTTDLIRVRESRKESVTQKEQTTLDQLIAGVTESNLKKRSPDKINEFLNQLAPGQTIKVDAQGLRDYIDQTTTELEEGETGPALPKQTIDVENNPALVKMNEAIDEAIIAGGTVELSLGDFAQHIIGTEHEQALRPFMKMTDGAMTPTEINDHRAAMEQIFKEIESTAEEDQKSYDEAKTLVEGVQAQLQRTGTVNRRNAKIMSELFAARITQFAREKNVSIKEAFKMSGFGGITGQHETTQQRLDDEAVLKSELDLEALIADFDDLGFDSEMTPEEKALIMEAEPEERLGRLLEVTGLGEDAAWTDERLNRVISENLSMDWTDSRIAFVDPASFVNSTHPDPQVIADEAGILDEEKLKGEEQTPFIWVDGMGRIVAHEGRHRMAALSAAGVSRVPVRVRFMDGTDSIDTNDESRSYSFKGQEFDSGTSQDLNLDESYLALPENAELIKSKMSPDAAVVFQAQEQGYEVTDQTETEAFQKWAGDNAEIVESDEINDTDFSEDKPYVLRVFHGTTHNITEFMGGDKGNKEGHFGAINYFTSSKSDADDNYAGEGPDLTNRIEQRAEQLEYEIQESIDENGIENVIFESGLVDEGQFNEAMDIARELVREELSGGQDQTLELFVRTEKPFIVNDENTPWIQFFDESEIESQSIDRVAENNDLSVEEVTENRDEHDDEIMDARYEIMDEMEHPLIEAVNTVASRYDIDPAEILEQLYDVTAEGEIQHSNLEAALRSNEALQYVEDPKSGDIMGSQIVTDVIQELGFDSIILKNAEQQFESMNIDHGTSHVHVFDANNTNIKSATDNQGTFDRTDPNILNQSAYHGTPHQFDKFSLDAMGSGEGAQAYGWGLYFASKRSVAEWYREVLARSSDYNYEGNYDASVEYGLRTLKEYVDDSDYTIEYLIENPVEFRSYIEGIANSIEEDMGDGWGTRAGELRELDVALIKPPSDGNLYQVDIPESDLLLDWDALINDQPSFIKTALSSSGIDVPIEPSLSEIKDIKLRKIVAAALKQDSADNIEIMIDNDRNLYNDALAYGKSEGLDMDEASPGEFIAEQVEDFVNKMIKYQKFNGAELYRGLIERGGSDQAASELLNSIGIPGLRYLDGTSRGTDGDSSNYVIWDENSVTVEAVNDEVRQAEQLEQQESEQIIRGQFNTVEKSIALFKDADLSTFAHEMAHFFLDLEQTQDGVHLGAIKNWYRTNTVSVAEEAGVTEADVISYLDNETTGDPAIDRKIYVTTHEQFARSFEAYLMEGKSPSMELRRVFKAFAEWLTQIYRTVKGLNVPIDDQIRAVFDRMLASDEQVAMANTENRYAPLFTDAVMAGMGEAQYEKYIKKQKEATDRSEETLFDKMVKQIRTRETQWWNDERNSKADDIEEQLSTQSVYVARAALSIKSGNVKLDRASVKEALGVEVLPPQFRNMTLTGGAGMNLDEAADLFGFDSGDAMVNAMNAAPTMKTAARDQAEAEMIQKHGDILNDGTIEEIAQDAVHDENRGELILIELKALNRGRRVPAVEKQNLKKIAADKIDELSLKEIRPDKYRRAEIKAAQDARSALEKGDRNAAKEAKTRQAMNFYLYRAAQDAHKNAERVTKFMAKFRKTSVRETLAKAESGYLQRIDEILSRFEFRKSVSVKKARESRQSIESWANERAMAGDNIQLTTEVLDGEYRRHYREVPFGELMGIYESTKNIDHVARFAEKMRLAKEELDFNVVKDQLITELEANKKDKPTPDADARNRKFTNTVKSFISELTKVPFIIKWLDGGKDAGLWHMTIMQRMTDAQHDEITLWEETMQPVMQMIQQMPRKQKAKMQKRFNIIGLKNTNTNQESLTGSQILSIALNTGNESNLRKMMMGEGWVQSEEEVSFDHPLLQQILGNMSKEDWDMVQSIWDRLDSLFPLMDEVHYQTSGLRVPKIDATEVVTPYGTYKGGYYPIKYDTMRSPKASKYQAKQDAMIDSMFDSIGLMRPNVHTGANIGRTEYYAPIAMGLDVIPNHLQEVIHYITHFDAVRQSHKILNDPDIVDVMTRKLGHHDVAEFREWLNRIAKSGHPAPNKSAFEPFMRRLRFGITIGTMGFKASTGIVQVLGLSTPFAKIGRKYSMKAVRTLYKNPAKIPEMYREAAAKSKVLPHRLKTFDREVMNAFKTLEKGGKIAKLQEASMKHIGYIQLAFGDLPTWYAAYYKEHENALNEYEKLDSGDYPQDALDDAESRAVMAADWSVENLQGSGSIKDQARIMASSTEFVKMLTMFSTFFSSLFGMNRDLMENVREGRQGTKDVIWVALTLYMIPVFVEMMMRDGFPDDDELEDGYWQQYLTNLVLYPAASVPLLRDIASAVMTPFGFNPSPVFSLIGKGVDGVVGVASGDPSASELKNATKLIAAAAGIPGTGQAFASGEHLNDVMKEGDDFTVRELLFGPEKD